MKNYILTALLMGLFSICAYSQSPNTSLNIGDVFIIGEVSNNNYKHIDFPRPNFILKKGGRPNYDNIKGESVDVTSIRKKKNGTLVATIKLSSDKLFFNSHRYVAVDIEGAIRENELYRI